MEWQYRLLKIQNQSWFFGYKNFFCQHLSVHQDLGEIFEQAKEQFPELGRRLAFPLRLPNLPFSFKCILYGTSEYPKSFYLMNDPPLILTVVGHCCWQEYDGLSVVGSRDPVSESLQWINEELGQFVETRRPMLVSGGARGIDQAVHSLAIRKKVPTVVFLPSGLGQIYPAVLEKWIPQIVEGGGCLISEYEFGQRIERSLFHHRNRLIAHMSLATLIVQASERSGTLMTGHLAAEAGKPCWVVPGHPLRRVFRGNLQLLRESNTLVCTAHDLSELFAAEDGTLNNKTVYVDV